ncbi:ABC transporter permease [Spiroplasma helicoides]|uniref:ABC transporter permease n=1 Tax=Spiroplasma helicoides TaxID=216938 RepID=A0A1B3SL55_9MOLU|nr:hypothetical protein [Spiroplasma helicoides]AOG60659.1 ABC transporter permease [Spiroplasma helicoides]
MEKKWRIKLRTGLVSFSSLYRLSFKTYLRSPINVFLGIFLFYFICLMWLLFRSDDPFILASATGAIIVRNSIHMLYRNLSIHKVTGFSTKLEFTPVNPVSLLLAHITANLTIVSIACAGLMGIVSILFGHQRLLIANVNWYMYISGALLLYITFVLMCFIMYIYVNDVPLAMIFANMFYIISWYFLGCAYPYYILSKYQILNWIMYFFPARYMMNVMQAGWVNSTNLKYTDTLNAGKYNVDWKLTDHLTLPYFVTLGIIIFLVIVLATTIIFKLNKHKKDSYGASLIQKLSSRYISEIKRCGSLEDLKNLRNNHLKEIGYNKRGFNYGKINNKSSKESKSKPN